jgi:hypothetical protein
MSAKYFTTLVSVPAGTIAGITLANKLFGTPALTNNSLFYNLLLDGFTVFVNSVIIGDDDAKLIYYAGAVGALYNAWFYWNHTLNDADSRASYTINGIILGWLVSSLTTDAMNKLISGAVKSKRHRPTPLPVQSLHEDVMSRIEKPTPKDTFAIRRKKMDKAHLNMTKIEQHIKRSFHPF